MAEWILLESGGADGILLEGGADLILLESSIDPFLFDGMTVTDVISIVLPFLPTMNPTQAGGGSWGLKVLGW